MDKNLLKMAGIIIVVIGILMLISWVFSDETSEKSNREFQQRVTTEGQKMQRKIER